MNLLFLCLKIFFVRVFDVSLGTFRSINTMKGKNVVAACIGFVEVLVWFLVVREALNTPITSIFIPISYAGGYATGTFLGGIIANIFIKGTLTVQIFTENAFPNMVEALRDNGYAVTILDAKGKDKSKNMLFIEIDKKHLKSVENIVKKHDKDAFIVVNETKSVANGYFKDIVK